MLKTLFRYPVKTNEVTGVCFDKLSRILTVVTRRSIISSKTRNKGTIGSITAKTYYNEPEIWSTKGWEFFQTEINSVLIVDMPSVEQNPADKYPQPYLLLPVASSIDYRANLTTGVMDYIIFRQDGERIAVIDDARNVIEFSERTKNHNIGELLIDNPHDVGYCPARFFWNEPLSLSNPTLSNPANQAIGGVGLALFYHISKRHLDLYGAYPIYSGYEQSCDFSNGENGDYCDGGFLKDKQGRSPQIDAAGL